MNRWLQKLDERREPPGVETSLLRRMPAIFVLGSLLHVAAAALARVAFDAASRQVASIDIFLIASLLTFWTAVFTVSIACFIVFVMKGPAYVADAYAVDDASRPRR